MAQLVNSKSASVISPRRACLVLMIGALLAMLLAWQIILPLRLRVSERYVQRGDTYLVAQDFETAQQQYQLALEFNDQNAQATEHLRLAKVAGVDIAQAADFFREHQVQTVMAKLNRAQQAFKDPKAALKVGVSFFEQQDFVYAQYPLQQAVRMDPQYPEAWHYLGLTYQALAKNDTNYQKKAEAAFLRQNQLTPKYLAP